jgi:hypothetical protein
MGPLTFNVYETALATVPGNAVAFALGFLKPYEQPPLEVDSNLNAFTQAWMAEIFRIAPGVQKAFAPFLPPLILLLVAWISARACLKSRDSTPATRVRCRNAHLYYDGAFGLLPQTMVATAVSLVIVGQLPGWRDSQTIFFVTAGLLGVVSLPILIYLAYHKFPKLLFSLNGYSEKEPKLSDIWKRKPENAAPWHKYTLAMMFGGGFAAWATVALVAIIQVVIIRYVALGTVWLRFWLQRHV